MIPNPIVFIRHQLGLSQKGFCQVAGIRPDNLYLNEHGLSAKPSKRVLDFLSEAGYDVDEVQMAYKAYRSTLQAETRKKLRVSPGRGSTG
jgi:transcriptional regulator with XRE-family HTH domain